VRVGSAEGMVEIAVSDQGMGMSAEQQAVIFGDFVQADSSDTRRFGGLGLGLAVVRRVADGLGGTIRCRSAPGRGATFTIVLPAWPAVSRFDSEPDEPANGGAGGNGSTVSARRSPTSSRARS
jgi:two-component system sensor histidine kinase SenX3